VKDFPVTATAVSRRLCGQPCCQGMASGYLPSEFCKAFRYSKKLESWILLPIIKFYCNIRQRKSTMLLFYILTIFLHYHNKAIRSLEVKPALAFSRKLPVALSPYRLPELCLR